MTPHPNTHTSLQRMFTDMFDAAPLLLHSTPLRERVIGRLADLMFCAEDVLDMLAAEPAGPLRECERPVRSAYDSINALMKTLCD